ncbi:class I SAM-dependent methyltransferase [Halobacteriovorax sp. ZH5_bin.2]|uniref:class I SAM-dependent methyltransferase n=1 Tax=Halobacteriovorax sp. ZH5_bin.2 TaxID=3157727 RepID=UPI0037162D34
MFNIGKECTVDLDPSQFKSLQEYNNKIESGKLTCEQKACICGNKSKFRSTSVTYDRYGIYSPIVQCLECSLLIVGEYLDEESLINFYINDYRPIYSESYRTPKYIFECQVNQGHNFIKTLKDVNITTSGKTVLEVGCGPGGILESFKRSGANVFGCDFDEDFMNYGRKHSIDIRTGQFDSTFEHTSFDIIVLSHLLEHIDKPLDFLSKIKKQINPGGTLLIEVPGILELHKGVMERYFQGVHLYNFYGDYLRFILESFGFDVLYIDESLRAVCQNNRGANSIEEIQNKLKEFGKNIDSHYLYLENEVRKYNSGLNFYFYKRQLINKTKALLESLKLKSFVKYIYKKVLK